MTHEEHEGAAMRLKDLPPTLTVEQAGAMLGIPRATAYRAATAGQLPMFRIGRRLLVPTAGSWTCSAWLPRSWTPTTRSRARERHRLQALHEVRQPRQGTHLQQVRARWQVQLGLPGLRR